MSDCKVRFFYDNTTLEENCHNRRTERFPIMDGTHIIVDDCSVIIKCKDGWCERKVECKDYKNTFRYPKLDYYTISLPEKNSMKPPIIVGRDDCFGWYLLRVIGICVHILF